MAAVGSLLLIVSTFGPFSFVEAAEILTALAVLLLLKKRADGSLFHLPFGDGTVIAAAGAWCGLLILIRFFDRPPGQNLLALACAALVFGAGMRERAKRPMDDLPPETVRVPGSGPGPADGGAAAAAAGSDAAQPPPDAATERIPRDEEPTERVPGDAQDTGRIARDPRASTNRIAGGAEDTGRIARERESTNRIAGDAQDTGRIARDRDVTEPIAPDRAATDRLADERPNGPPGRGSSPGAPRR